MDRPMNLAFELNHGEKNPKCFWAEDPVYSTIRVGDFVGSVKEGGDVNYQRVSITPHGNGTHTECYGHISADETAIITNTFNRYHFIAKLISLPVKKLNGDDIVLYEGYLEALGNTNPEAVIIRTLPNDDTKKLREYSGNNPPYIEAAITEHMVQNNILHLLLDLPSVDRESDEGKLAAHHKFWNMGGEIRKDCTITELIYVPNHVKDGLYLLNLQVPNMAIDAVPSRPVIYELREENV